MHFNLKKTSNRRFISVISQRINKCSVKLKGPLNPQLAVIVNKVTLHGISEAKYGVVLPPFEYLISRWDKEWVLFISSAVIPSW